MSDSPLARLERITADLASAHRELSELLAAEHEGKVRTWMASEEDTIGGRDRIAAFQVLDLSTDILKLKGEISALTAERDFMVLIVQKGLPWPPARV